MIERAAKSLFGNEWIAPETVTLADVLKPPPASNHGSIGPRLTLTNDDGLSMELDAMYPAAQPIAPPTGWHGRRLLTFGASEVPALLIALGMEQADDATPGYVLELAERLIDIKAGLRKPRKAGAAADRGSAAEAQVVEAWNTNDRGDWPAITYASSVPREWLPLIDRHQPRLSCTPDAWCYIGGELVNVQIKTDVRGDKSAPTREWVWQVNAECAVTGAAGSLLLYAPGWASWRREDKRRCVAWVVERDDAMIDRIRDAAAQGWQLVEQARAAARKETSNER